MSARRGFSHLRNRRRPLRARALLLAAALACTPSDEDAGAPRGIAADGVTIGYGLEGTRHVRTIVGFHDPESVLHDPEQDVYFVTNMMGFGSHHDATAAISRVDAQRLEAGARTFIQSGIGGVTLHAPKGMVLQGDTLWVTDIDVVRGFHRRTGAPLRTIDFAAQAPILLNDIALGPDGVLRVTDTGIRMVFEGNIHTGPSRIFEVQRSGAVRPVADSTDLRQPNGIVWDSTAARWVVVSFDPIDAAVVAAAPGDTAGRVLFRHRRLDGLVALGSRRYLVSSWADSSIHRVENGRSRQLVRDVPEPADIGYDARRRRLLIPLAMLGQLQIWQLPRDAVGAQQ
jgi:sugar lactone lactonase YvrE